MKRRGFWCWLFGCRWVVVRRSFTYGDSMTLVGVECRRCGRTDNG